MDCVVGIDIGVSGAIVITNKNYVIIDFYPMPIIEKTLTSKTPKGNYKKRDIYDEEELEWIFRSAIPRINTKIFIERPQAMPGLQSHAIGTAFEGFGFIKGLMHANDFEFEEIHSATWSAHIFKGMEKGKGKERSLKLFAERYPKFDMDKYLKRYHDGIADAAHIARYGWDMVKGEYDDGQR